MPRKYLQKYPKPLHLGYPPRSGRTPADACPTCEHDAIAHGARGCMECSCVDFDDVDQCAFDIDEDRFGPQD